ncbi:MAG TPA: ABC transporter substrate-binding protein [Acidimicrobiia bacterium]|nr:ABC transporter substrate-binding protein [Acidimicrobiia bacterium]
MPSPFTHLRRIALAIGLAVGLVALSSCGGNQGSPTVVRLGYFANVTHAPALVGVDQGFFADELGEDVALQLLTFNAGPDAITALFSDSVDMTFIGPNPAINGYAQSGGTALRIIAGSTSGGAALVVRPGIASPADLVGAKIATPQLGNTQDVALRAWLLDNGLSADLEGGGDVSVVPQANAQTLETFRAGDIDGAWVPEPWASRLVLEGGGTVLVDERDIWPGGRFVTTHLIVRTAFLEEHPDLVLDVLRGLVRSIDFIEAQPAAAMAATNRSIETITGKALSTETITSAWGHLSFTVDPIASSLYVSADHAVAVGLLEPVDLSGIYDLDLLNQTLGEMGRAPVTP